MDKLVDNRKRNWFYVENQLIDRTDLDVYEKMAYVVLVRHSNANGECFPSYMTLALKIGCSERKAKTIVKSLMEKGLIDKKERFSEDGKTQLSNLYKIQNLEGGAHDDIPQKINVENKPFVFEEGEQGAPTPVNGVHEGGASENLPPVHDMHTKETNTKETNLRNEIYIKTIEYLNEKAGTNFRVSESAKKHINARLEEGYSLEDIKKVVDIKTIEWKNTEFEKYLRPSTLFGSKFENYINQKTYSKQPIVKTKLHNFQQWTDEVGEQELNDLFRDNK